MIRDVFIGYDAREAEAARVCWLSMARRTSQPLRAVMLKDAALRRAGLYTRLWEERDGARVDQQDGKPFSTDFAFTRFLVPALMLYEGWALFCDCDFLFTADIAGIFELARERYAVMVVKHDHVPRETEKMDAQPQQPYRRKNWSSLMLWNCAHPANRVVTPALVNRRPGQFLHAFEWLPDSAVGELPMTWNWLAGVNDPLPDDAVPCGVHYTLGGPWFEGREPPFSDLWRAEAGSRRLPGRPTPTEFLRAREPATQE